MKIDAKKINKFRSLFPQTIHVSVVPCEGEEYAVSIQEFPGAITQAKNLADLIYMVSDCVATVLEVPSKYLSYMPSYLPSLELAQALNSFPQIRKERKAELSIKGEVACAKS